MILIKNGILFFSYFTNYRNHNAYKLFYFQIYLHDIEN